MSLSKASILPVKPRQSPMKSIIPIQYYGADLILASPGLFNYLR